MTSISPWICQACALRQEDNTCPAFPNGITLKPDTKPLLHDVPLPGQVGDTVFEFDEGNPMAGMVLAIVEAKAVRNGGDPGMNPDTTYEDLFEKDEQ